ncbi:MAG: malonyl-ACP O-methyltransferase BioC [Victivallaceae bacterium]|nr:malonyl-ACP O-methyltransferase BioC [Victivallaceae bacterium]
MNKDVVRQRFGRHLPTYRRYAIVQREMALKLLKILEERSGRTGFRRIFEIGCGSGLLSEKIEAALTYDTLFLNDIVDGCADLTLRIDDSVFLAGDVETVDFPAPLDLVVSNAALQWAADLRTVFVRAHEALRPGGIFAFSSFSPRNLGEIRALCGRGLVYREPAKIAELGREFFTGVEVCERKTVLRFDTPLDVLKHLKYTGVNGVDDGVRWTRGELEEFCRDYERRFGEPGGRVPLTFAPVYFLGRKE